MKGGQKPIHIQRWAPVDYVTDPFVKLLVRRRDYQTFTLYNLVLNWSFIEGGDLPADIEALAAVIGMPTQDVETSLPICLDAVKLHIEETCLFNARVRREVFEELAFRKKQSKLGRKGGRPKGSQRLSEGKPKARVSESKSPPAPAPLPAPAPAPSGDAKGIRIPACEESPLNDAIVAACRELALLTGKDETEVLKAHSMIPNSRGGGPRWIVRLDAASEDWRIRTHQDLQAELSRLKAPADDNESVQGLPTKGPWEKAG